MFKNLLSKLFGKKAVPPVCPLVQSKPPKRVYSPGQHLSHPAKQNLLRDYDDSSIIDGAVVGAVLGAVAYETIINSDGTINGVQASPEPWSGDGGGFSGGGASGSWDDTPDSPTSDSSPDSSSDSASYDSSSSDSGSSDSGGSSDS